MSKPFDLDETKWTRRLVPKNIALRFKIHNPESGGLIPMDIAKCPECGCYCRPRLSTFPDNNGKVVVTYYPQCEVKPNDPNHGFGPESKHGTRSRSGRVKKDGEVKPEVKPDPIVEVKAPQVVVSDVPDIGEVVHSQVKRAFKYVMAGIRNIYLTGPAGTGKSYAGEQLLRLLHAADPARWPNPKGAVIGTVGMGTMNSEIVGYISRSPGTEGQYIESWFVKGLRAPTVTIVEEADKGNPNLAGAFNMPLANGKIPTPGGVFDRHADSVVIFVGNTTGHAPNKQYGGSVRQDYATLDRFRIFTVGYEKAVEFAAIPGLTPAVWDYFQTIRAKAEKAGFQRILGTRELGRMVLTMKVEGKGHVDAMKIMAEDGGWSADEKLAVL